VIENFMRTPLGGEEKTADAVRVLGALSLVAAGVGWGWVAFWVTALALLGVYASRFLGLRASLDIALGLTLLTAAWSSVLDLYAAIPSWDIAVHFAANGLLAAALYVVAQRLHIVPAAAPARATTVLTACFGITAAVVWEIAEWAGHNFIDASIFVAYTDTIGDLAAGALGSILAGCSMRHLGVRGDVRVAAGARL
jgi:hypothetical protein